MIWQNQQIENNVTAGNGLQIYVCVEECSYISLTVNERQEQRPGSVVVGGLVIPSLRWLPTVTVGSQINSTTLQCCLIPQTQRSK